MNIKKQLGMRIHYLIKQKGYSQLTFSYEIGVNKNYLCDLEKGRRNPTLEILEKICKGLELNLEDLFKGIVELK